MSDDKSNDTVKEIVKGAIFAGMLYKGSKEILKRKSEMHCDTDEQVKDNTDDFTYDDSINKCGNTSSNLANGGFIAAQGGHIYYSYCGSLYKAKIDNACVQKIDNGVNIHNINAVGKYIYFSSSSGIFKFADSGNEKFKLSDTAPEYMMVVEDRIFYTDKDNLLHYMTTDGENIELSRKIHCSNLNIYKK